MFTAGLSAAAMGLYMLNRGNPLYEDMEDWAKDTHFHFFIPTPKYYEFLETYGRKPETVEEARPLYNHWWYPSPWELGGVAMLTVRALEGVLDDQPVEAAWHMGRVVRNMFRFEYLPQIIAPATEVMMNESRFFERPIETKAMEDLPPWLRSGSYTSKTMQSFGVNVIRKLPRKAQVLSPVQIEHLLKGYLNAWAMYGLTLSDAMFYDDARDIPIERIPGLRSFYPRNRTRSRFRTEFYDMLREATEVRRAMRLMDKSFRPEIADELEQEQANANYDQLGRAGKQASAIHAEIKAVQSARTLAQLQAYAKALGREREKRTFIAKLQAGPDWNDLGVLKGLLIDHWVDAQDSLFRDVVTSVKEQAREPLRLELKTPQGRNALEQRSDAGAVTKGAGLFDDLVPAR